MKPGHAKSAAVAEAASIGAVEAGRAVAVGSAGGNRAGRNGLFSLVLSLSLGYGRCRVPGDIRVIHIQFGHSPKARFRVNCGALWQRVPVPNLVIPNEANVFQEYRRAFHESARFVDA